MTSSKTFTRQLLALAATTLASVLVVASCSGPAQQVECYDAGQCSGDVGELVACVDNDCTSVECLSSSDCPLGKICSVEDEDYTCESGCNGDADCPAGFECGESGVCEEYGCRSSLLDCNFGEFCNEDTGECEADTRPHCTSCDPLTNEWYQGDIFDNCDDYLIGNPTCGGTGAVCNDWDLDNDGNLTDWGCYVGCEVQEDCPMGFMCWTLDQPYGNGQDPFCDQNNTYFLGFCVSDCAPD